MSKKLNHSRHIDYFAKDISNNEYWKTKKKPTHKQIKFYNQLYAICKENNVDTKTDRYTVTRVDYSENISTLISRLKEAGIEIGTDEKNVRVYALIGEDRRGRMYVREGVDIETDDIVDPSLRVHSCEICKEEKDYDKEIAWLRPGFGICLLCYSTLGTDERERLEKAPKQKK